MGKVSLMVGSAAEAVRILTIGADFSLAFRHVAVVSTSFDDLALIRAHERKVRDAVDALAQVRHLLLAVVADTRDTSHALHRQAGQARHRAHELLNDAVRLTATAERLVAEARSIHRERA